MRSLTLALWSGISLCGSGVAFADALRDETALQVAQQVPSDSQGNDRSDDRNSGDNQDNRRDRPMTRQEIRERRRELREQERELEEEERQAHERRMERFMLPRAWIGFGAGIGVADVRNCSRFDCSGTLGTYNANVTVSGPYAALRLRGVREQNKGQNSHTPYEEAALIGSRFGHSNWYGLVGYGRILHPDDAYTKGDARGFAWEILFAPSMYGPVGLELSFQGNQGNDVSYATFNIAGRFGLLR